MIQSLLFTTIVLGGTDVVEAMRARRVHGPRIIEIANLWYAMDLMTAILTRGDGGP